MTSAELPPSDPRPSDAAKLTWLGHATVLLEMDGIRVLTDPVLRNRVGPLVRYSASPSLAGSTVEVDCILLSHLHADHADPPSLRQVSCSGPVIGPRSSRAWLASRGMRHVRELGPDSEIRLDRLLITATQATHDDRRRPLGPTAEPVGYLISGSRTVYFAGDTDVFGAMAELRGTVDCALLPIWGWGPSVGAGHMDPERAAAAAALISPAVVIPIHWGTFALRRPAHPDRPAVQFGRLMQRYAPGVEVRLLSPGESTNL